VATAAAPVARPKVGSVVAGVILTVLLLWMFGATAHVFLLLFIAIIVSLYLGAVRDLLVEKAHMPPRLAFFVSVVGTFTALLGLFAILLPPVVEQTRSLITVLPTYIETWEKGIDTFVARFPAMRDVWKPGEHPLISAVYDQLSQQAETVVPRVLSFVNFLIDTFAVVPSGCGWLNDQIGCDPFGAAIVILMREPAR